MVIDSSALLSVLLDEANAASIALAIESASQRLLSTATLLETSIVIESRKGEAGARELDLLLFRAAIEVIAVDPDQPEIARVAWRRFRKGPASGRARLRRLICLRAGEGSWTAVAVSGDDFSRTDIVPVLPPTPALRAE